MSDRFVVWPDNRGVIGILILHTNIVTPISVKDGQTEIILTVAVLLVSSNCQELYIYILSYCLGRGPFAKIGHLMTVCYVGLTPTNMSI